ncbi:CaiB/BaiF CoA-transferase family protein [Caballeronia sp. LZ035]|uniref:CaiB/BaiF CoA transferase family protein n=1 Tax=Caballeronia sp. LZ035 TaxID=3038568 RepID=UPI0028541C32|nr:CaiB/BaiF CoA-transferase family protein [Caballeronia sp. LZ035]MDR5761028.1 CaiB/BaiF CoA-transferase family protein [Caballeronia sp. LZ035]
MNPAGPLAGLKVVEFGAIGPVPFCAMLLADLGADIIQVIRPAGVVREQDFMQRGRRFVPLDLKRSEDRDAALQLVAVADVVLEGNRPGVMEKLGLGPDVCLEQNPKLVYGRMTGWGQDGPLALRAGHDINYIALTGALDAIGTEKGPVVPLNLVGDYGGGSMFLAFGVLAAVHEARSSGQGQVVDAAMVDGASYLMSLFYRLRSQNQWQDARGTNALDGGAPWYGTYRTADDRWVAVGAIEEPFWQELLSRLGILASDLPPRSDTAGWPRIRERLATVFHSQSRDHWAALFADSDACVCPVLSMEEAHAHAHLKARNTFIEVTGTVRPAPAPRFSRSPAACHETEFRPIDIQNAIDAWRYDRR